MVNAVRKVTSLPVIPKLTPNVTDVASFARAAEEAGADAISLVNTFLAMAIDVHTRRPKLTNIVGGLSGPAIRPIAVRMVYECRRVVKIPIIGMGGIATADDVLEFMIAGANAVQVGTMNFVDPFIWTKLMEGIQCYMDMHKLDAPAGHRRHGGHDGARKGVDQLLVALDVETARAGDGARRRAARGPLAASRLAAACSRPKGQTSCARSWTAAIASSSISSGTTFRTRSDGGERPPAASASGWSTCTQAAASR